MQEQKKEHGERGHFLGVEIVILVFFKGQEKNSSKKIFGKKVFLG